MYSRLVEKALEIAGKRRHILTEMRKAVEAGDKEAVFTLAQELTGLSDEKCHRTDSRVN